MNENELIGFLTRQIKEAGSESAWARKYEISVAYVNGVVNRRQSPGPAILAALDVERVISYRKKRQDQGPWS